MKRLLLLFALCGAMLCTQAQEQEIYLQLNPVTMHAKSGGVSDTGSLFGVALGYNHFFTPFSDDAVKVFGGGKFSYTWKSEGGETTRFLRFSLPVSIGYRFTAGEFGIMPLAGIDISDILLAKSGDDSFYDSNLGDAKAKSFQFGFHAGADFDYKQFVLGVAYQQDLTKFQDYSILGADLKTHFSEVEIKLGYRF